MAVHQVAGGAQLAEAEFSRFPGLYACHFVTSPDQEGAQLTTYWRSRDHFAASAGSLEDRLKPSTRLRDGFLHRLVTAREPFWKRTRFWYALALHLAAIFGAFQAAHGTFLWLLSTSSVSVSPAEGEPVNRLRSSPLALDLRVTNLHPSVSTTVVLDEVVLAPVTPSQAEIPQPHISSGSPVVIGGGGSVVLRVNGDTAMPGRYLLEVRTRSKSGRLRGWVETPATFTLVSWPQLAAGPVSVDKVEGGKCWLRSSLIVGAGHGGELEGEAVLVREPGVTFSGIVFPGTLTWPAPTYVLSPGKEVASLIWPVPPTAPFQEIDFHLVLSGASSTDWHRVAKSLRIEFYRKPT